MGRPTRIMDLMRTVRDYPVITPSDTITKAWRVMSRFYRDKRDEPGNESPVLVVDEESRLVGLVNRGIIMRNIDSRLYGIALRVPGGFLENDENGATGCLLPRRMVSAVMLPAGKIALKSTDTTVKALFMLLNNNLGTLPVINIYQQVIGMVHAGDVFHNHGLGSGFCKTAFMGYEYIQYGLFDDYYAGYDETVEKKVAPQHGAL